MKIIIVTGLSGSGKSTVLNYLEDKDFYCVDNLPLQLFDKFLEIIKNTKYDKIAIGLDIREYFINNELKKIKNEKRDIFLLYLQADLRTLYKRYNESRRKHPVNAKTLENSIKQEINILKEIKSYSDFILDTSNLSVKNLYNELDNILFKEEVNYKLSINIISFGFKHGNYNNAHLMFDVRFLPNPFFVETLKEKTGLDEDVYNFVTKQVETKKFLSYLIRLLDYLIPLYEKERRHYLNIAVGCTGGKHRSVSIARYLYDHLKNEYNTTIIHRDLGG